MPNIDFGFGTSDFTVEAWWTIKDGKLTMSK